MASSYSWTFLESYLGKHSDTHSYERTNGLEFKTLNTNSALNAEKYNGIYNGYQINEYDDIAYLDLNNVCNPDGSFTLEFKVVELGEVDTSKAVNYITFGYQIRGRSGVSITVGRDQGSKNVVLGTITDSINIKGVSLEPTMITEANTVYEYTLTFNNFATHEEKIRLYRGYELLCTSDSMDIKDYSIVDRKLFLGSSAWTNEASWEGSFDIARNLVFVDGMTFHVDKVIDKTFIPGSPYYPVHYAFSNITNANRNQYQVAVEGDYVNIMFHSTKDVPTNQVFMSVDGYSNNMDYVVQVDVQNPFILENGSNTVLYSYQMQVSDIWPKDGLLSYGLNMYGSKTLSNIFPSIETNMYIDNTIPEFRYKIYDPSDQNIAFSVLHISDAYFDVMTNKVPYENYSATFYASNDNHVRSTTIVNPIINNMYYVEGLSNETIYTLYATLTDRAGNITEKILPDLGTSMVETLDITSPVIQYINKTTITDDPQKRPGIHIAVSTYDTATQLTINVHNYNVYVVVLDVNIDDINVVESIITNVNAFNAIEKTNFEPEVMQQDVFTYYDTNNIEQVITTEKMFYIYCYVVDNSQNRTFSKTSHFINNNITLKNIYTNFGVSDIAQLGNTITMEFLSDFKLYSKDQFNITMMEDTITNAVSSDGLNWVANNTVKSTNASGRLLFTFKQTPDIDLISEFNHNIFDEMYIQKEAPSFKPGTQNTITTGLTSLTITNLGNYINDHTINSNNNLFKLEITVDGKTQGGVYNNKSELPSSFTFENLLENDVYEVRATLSNLFKESVGLLIGSEITKKDIPTISIASTTNQITTSSDPLVQISSASRTTEFTSKFDIYVAVSDFDITDSTNATTFLKSTTPQSTNNTQGQNIDLTTIIPSTDFTTYFTGSFNNATEIQIIPSTKNTYYLYALIDDTATPPIYSKEVITFDFTFTVATLTNDSYDYFVRNGDTVRMSWSTTYRSQVSDFSDIKIFGNTAVPTSSDGLNWTATTVITSGTPDHSVSYLGKPLTIITNQVLYDNAAPTFDVEFVSKNTTSLTFTLNNFGSDTYTNQQIPVANISTIYKVHFTTTFLEDNSVKDFYFNVDYNNLITNNYTLNTLTEAKEYKVSCILTDPANNTITVNYNNYNPIQTSDITIPTINNLTSSIATKESNNIPGFTVVSNTSDNNEYTVYISIYNYQLSGSEDTKKNMIMSKYLTTDFLTIINTNNELTKNLFKHFREGDTTQHDIHTEETYYVYCLAIDLDGNFIISNNVITIDNILSNQTIFTDFYKNDVAEAGNTITITFTSQYRIFDYQLNVLMMGDTIVPTSSDGITWIAVNTVSLTTHSSGKVLFSVAQTPDIGINVSNFDETLLDPVYIQLENPTLINYPVDFNIYEITVSVSNGKYVFFPTLSELVKGFTYIFTLDESAAPAHPLRFTYSPNHPTNDNEVVFMNDINHKVIANITTNITNPLYAHCAYHSNMGSIVNGANGIPISTANTTLHVSSTTNTIDVENIAYNIDDFTINSNNDLVKIDITVRNTSNASDTKSLSQNFANKSTIPDKFSFNDLKEYTNYEISVSLSNLFSETLNINIGTVSTSLDISILQIDAIPSILNDQPVVELSNTSRLTEKTSPYDLYIEVFDFEFSSTSVEEFFVANATKRLTNASPGQNIDFVSLLTSNTIDNYWSFDGTSYQNNTIIPSTLKTFYIYGMITDDVIPITFKTSITFDFTISQPTVSNQTIPYFVRNDDRVYMSWNTTYKSQATDFTNIKIFDQIPSVAPMSTDQTAWSIYVDIPSSGIPNPTFTMNYLTLPVAVSSSNVFFDNEAPSFSISLNNTTETSFTFKLANLGNDVYTNQPIPLPGVSNTYKLLIKATNAETNQVSENLFENIEYTNLTINSFTIDGLMEGKAYSILMILTDPAHNESISNYNNGSIIKTTDSTIPVISNNSISVIHNNGDEFVNVSNIQAYDAHSSFSVYVGLFSRNDRQVSLDVLKNNSGTNAVISQKNIPSRTSYLNLNGSFTSMFTHNGSYWVVDELQYDANAYLYIAVEDASGNVNLNGGVPYHTFLMNQGPSLMTFDPTTGEFLEEGQTVETDGQTIDATATIIQEAQVSLIFQEAATNDPFIDPEKTTPAYVGYDVSGNNNNIYLQTDTNPLNTNSVINEYSLDLGLITSAITFRSSINIVNNTVNLENESFTFSTYVNNQNDSFTNIVLLKNGTNDFITLTDSSVIINANSETPVVYPIGLYTQEWNSVVVSTSGYNIQVFINGVEILSTLESGMNYNPVQSTGILSIPPQENILIENTIIFNIPVNDTILQGVSNTGDFKIKMDFEEGIMTDFDVSFYNNKFYLNDIESPELKLNSNINYSFHQAYDANVYSEPFIISSSGSYHSSSNEIVDVSYFINDINLGNDPFKYSLEYRNSTTSKVVLHAGTTSNLFYHSINPIVQPVAISVRQLVPKILNKVNASAYSQPTYATTPSFSSDTVVGNYSLVFDSSKLISFDYNSFNIDANNISMSAWVKTDFTKQNNNPLITQDGVFEFGIDNEGKTYIKLLNNDIYLQYTSSIGTVAMTDTSVSISEITLNNNATVYVYALLSVNKLKKIDAIRLMDNNKDTEHVYFQAINTTTTTNTGTITFNSIFIDVNTTVSTSTVNEAYVYLSIRNDSNAFNYDIPNQFEEYNVSFSNNIPKIVLGAHVVNTDINNNTFIETSSVSIFNPIRDTKQYYLIYFKSDPTIFTAEILTNINDNVKTFIQSESFVSNFASNVQNGAIVNFNTVIPKKDIEVLSNLITSYAFNNLTDATLQSSIVATDQTYIPVFVLIDTNDNIHIKS